MPEGGRHARLWEWFEGLQPNVRPRPRAEYWPRGGAKSSTAELGTVRLGTKAVKVEDETRPSRRFVLYVCGTQDQANAHVEAIRQKFEDLGVERNIGKYGHSKGWKVDLLRTANGFNVLALGLDAASRGVKLDDYRPDLIILDDVDGRHDTPETVEKKIKTITESILPAGSTDCAILFIQNLIHAESIASKLATNKADFLLGREAAEPEPAVEGLKYELEEQPDGTRAYRITEGVPTWEGQDLQTCEQQLNDWGRAAFEREAQHNTNESDDGIWSRGWIEKNRVHWTDFQKDLLERVVVGVDPSGTAGMCGIVAKGRIGRGEKAHYYTLDDATPPQGTPPGTWADRAIDCYVHNKADAFAVETNFGAEMAETILRRAAKDRGVAIRIITVHASRGKQVRAEPVAELCQKGYEHHVGLFPELENEKCKWKAGDPSPNRLDADVWANTELLVGGLNVTEAAKQSLGSL